MHLPASSSLRNPAVETSTYIALSARSDTTCGFEGNNDIYGIGIRIGVYTQIFAVWFANYFLLTEAQALRDTVSIFSVAILIISLKYAAVPSEIYAVEAFVILQILAWSCMMGVRVNTSYTKGLFSRGSLVRRVICEVVNLMNMCLNVWFWWRGLDQMEKTPCGTFLMMYVVKTDMYGWARKVMMAGSLFVLICTVYWACVDFSRPWTFWKLRKARMEFSTSIQLWEESQHTPDKGAMEERTEKTKEEDRQSMRDDVSEHTLSHDACSKHSCAQCSPTRSVFTTKQEEVWCRAWSETPVVMSADSTLISRTSVQEVLSFPEPEVPVQSQHLNTDPGSKLEFELLKEVYESEHYIQACISASPYQMRSDGQLLTFSMIVRSILFPKKYRSVQEGKPVPPSWFRCQVETWKALLTFRLPMQVLAIYSHLRQSQLLDPLNGPFQTYAAMKYLSSNDIDMKKTPSWSSISLASSLLLTEAALPKKIWLGWYYVILDFLIHVVVILQLELTLHWNSVSELSGLWSSVGQLIPFIIGVSGLGLVLSRWIIRCWVKWRKGRGKTSGWERDTNHKAADNQTDEPNESFGLDPSVIEGYARWKEAYQLSIKRVG